MSESKSFWNISGHGISSNTSKRLIELAEPIERDEELALFEISTLVLIFVITVLGNSTVLLALWSRRRYTGRRKLSRMYFFILHLSIADLITAFSSVLPQLAWDISDRFYGGYFLCKIVKFVQPLGLYLSSYILMATAIDRYRAICYPLTYCSWTSRRSKVMVYVAWMLSLTFCSPQVFIFSYQKVSNYEYDCWATFSYEWGERAYVTWYCISIFIIPLIVLVFTYSAICRAIWLSSESSLRPRNSQNFAENRQLPLISRAKMNTIKQTVAVILMYIFCSSPFIGALLWASWVPLSPFREGVLFVILTLLYSLNSCFNPWVFLAFNRELPRLLLRNCRTSTKEYRSAGPSRSNSLGIQTSSVRSFTKWSICNASKTERTTSDTSGETQKPNTVELGTQPSTVARSTTIAT